VVGLTTSGWLIITCTCYAPHRTKIKPGLTSFGHRDFEARQHSFPHLIPFQLQLSVGNSFILLFLLDTRPQATLLFSRAVCYSCCGRTTHQLAQPSHRLPAACIARMAELASKDHSGDQVEVLIFSTPQYHINYGDDHTLQWTPPVGSKELAIALS
jgi:hypothetical protein